MKSKTGISRRMSVGTVFLILTCGIQAAVFETRVAANLWHADTDNTPGIGTWDVVSGSPTNTYPISGDSARFKHLVIVTNLPQAFSGGSLNETAGNINPVWRLFNTLTLDEGTLTFNAPGYVVIQGHGYPFINQGTLLHACNQSLFWDAYTAQETALINQGSLLFTNGGAIYLRQYGIGPSRLINHGTLSANGGNGKIMYQTTTTDVGLSNSVSGILMASNATLDIQVQLHDGGGTLRAVSNGIVQINNSAAFGQTFTSTGTLFETASSGCILLGGRAPQYQGIIAPNSEVRLGMNIIIPSNTVAFVDFSGGPLLWGGKTTWHTISFGSNCVFEFRSPTVWTTTQYVSIGGTGIVRIVEGISMTHAANADWYIRHGSTLENQGTLLFSGPSANPVRMDGTGSGSGTFVNASSGLIISEAGSRTIVMANSNQTFSNVGTIEVRNGSTLTIDSKGTVPQWNGAGVLTGGTWKLLAGTTNAVLNLDPANAGITTIGPDATVTLSKTGAGNPIFSELSPLHTVQGRLGLHGNIQYARTNLTVSGTLEFGLTNNNLSTARLVINGNPDFTGGMVDIVDLGLTNGVYTLATWTGTETGTLALGAVPSNRKRYELVQDNLNRQLLLSVQDARQGVLIQLR